MTTALSLLLLVLLAVVAVEIVQAQSPCATYTSEAGCGGQSATCNWHDGGDVGLAPTCRTGKACGSITAQMECDAANAFRCKWDTTAGQCKRRSLPSLRSCAPFGIAHNARPFTEYRGERSYLSNETFFAADLEMNDGRAILFGDADVARTALPMIGSTPTVVNGTHACFTDAVVFAADSADGAKWSDALNIYGDAIKPDWAPRPGIYHMIASSLRLSNSITFDAQGDPSVFWVIRVAGRLGFENLVVHLVGGARPQQIVWLQVGSYMQFDEIISESTAVPVRMVGVFIFAAPQVGTLIRSKSQLIVDGSILQIRPEGSLSLSAAAFGTHGSCVHFGTNATACLASQTPRCAVAATGVCGNLDCPTTKAQTGSCPLHRCRLDASKTYCADGLACPLAPHFDACAMVGYARCFWDYDGGTGCKQLALPPFPDTCRDYRVIYNGTDRNEFVLDGAVVSGGGQLVPFAVADGIPARPGNVCFQDAANFARPVRDWDAVSTADGLGEGEAREWVVSPGRHARSANAGLARDAAVIFDAKSDPEATFVLDVTRLRLGGGSRIVLRNGARSENILWLVSGQTELLGPRVPGTIMAIGASVSITTNGAPLTIDGRVVVLPTPATTATLILPGAALGRAGSCSAFDGNQAGCAASSLRCAYAGGECHPRPCFADTLTAQTCPLGRCRLAASGSVCASGIQCSAARTYAQCMDRYEIWKDCAWIAGACVEAHRRLPDTPACADYAAVVHVAAAPSRLGVSFLDMGKRRLVTNALPANASTITPARNASEVVNATATSACIAAVTSTFANPSALMAAIPARPVPIQLTASGTGGALQLLRGMYVLGPPDFPLNATITFDAEGDPAATWIVHASQLVRFGVGMRMQLVNRAQQRNIYWVSARATAGGWVSDGGAQSPPLLGTFVHLQTATGGIDFRGRKIVGRILSAEDNVELSRAAFVDECYVNANQATCASDTARSCLWMAEQCHAYPTECSAVRGQPTCASAKTLLGFPCVWLQNSTTCAPPPPSKCVAFTTESMCVSANGTLALACQWSSTTNACSERLSLPSSSSSSSDPLGDVLKIAIPVAVVVLGAGALVGLAAWLCSAGAAKDAVATAQAKATAALVQGRAARVKPIAQQSQQQQRRPYANLQTISLT